MQKPKPTIVTDLDGVLVDVVSGVMRLGVEKYGLVMHPEQCTAFDIGEMIATADGDETAKARMRAEVYTLVSRSVEFYDHLQPYPGAVQAVADLAVHFQVVVLTSRPLTVQSATRICLARHFPDVTEFHHCRMRNKPRVAAEFNPAWVLEDNPSTVESYLQEKVHVFYVRHGYGRDIFGKGLRRLYTVPDARTAADEILRMAGKVLPEGVAS